MTITINIEPDQFNDIISDLSQNDFKISLGTESLLEKVISETSKKMDILEEEISEFKSIDLRRRKSNGKSN